MGSLVKVSPMNQALSFDAKIIAIDPQLARQSRSLKYRAQINTTPHRISFYNTLIKLKIEYFQL